MNLRDIMPSCLTVYIYICGIKYFCTVGHVELAPLFLKKGFSEINSIFLKKLPHSDKNNQIF